MKEKNSACNVKDRKNRHNILRILGILESNQDIINNANKKGLFIFVGINNCENEIFLMLEPNLISKIFYYNCGNKFITDFMYDYFDDYEGTIIFANGELCIIYKYVNGKFEMWNIFESRICSKHNKGGSSSARFGRIADNIREKYTITIIENINKLSKKSNYIFGSKDIIDDIFERKNIITVELNNGGFVDFDKKTINDTNRWIQYMKNDILYDDIIEKTILLIDKGSNLLNFELNMTDKDNIENYEYIILCPNHPNYDNFENTEKIIKLQKASKFYGKIKNFVCIGKFYYEK